MRTSLLFSAGIVLIVCMVLAMPVSAVDDTPAPGTATLEASPPDLILEKVIPGEDTSGKTPPGVGTSSIGVFRPSTRQFIFNTNPVTRVTFGLSTDKPITGDWDGDGKTEIGVFRPSTREFIFLNKDGSTSRITYGLSTDKPITGDWDGDGDTEIGVFRPSTQEFILRSSTGSKTRVKFGMSTDIPLTINWNDAGGSEIAVWRPSSREFIVRRYDGSLARFQFGLSTDKPYTTWNSNGYTTVGVFRPSSREFIQYNFPPGTPSTRTTYGMSSDIPITGKVWATFTTPPPPGPETEIINAHQYWRNQVGSPLLTWSSSEASSAQSWANQLAIDGELHHNRPGQNAAWSGGSMTWTEVVNLWGSEKQYFKYGAFPDVRNSVACPCPVGEPGCYCYGDWRDVGHYTQVVWKATTQCGCGKAIGTDGTYYVCNYNPYGNMGGDYPY